MSAPFRQLRKIKNSTTGNNFFEFKLPAQATIATVHAFVPTGSAVVQGTANSSELSNLPQVDRDAVGASAWEAGATVPTALPAAGNGVLFSVAAADMAAGNIRLVYNLGTAGEFWLAVTAKG